MGARTTLVLDPGHGGTTVAGASTPNRGISSSGLFEKDLALELAGMVREQLRADHTVVLTREHDTNMSLADRAAAARRVEADYFVSLHMSGSPNGGGGASDAIVGRGASGGSTALAQVLVRRVGDVTGTRGNVYEANLGQLAAERHHAATAACLLEIASLDDPMQAERFMDRGFRMRIADAIANSVREVDSASPAVAPQWLGTRFARTAAVVTPNVDYRATSLVDAVSIWTDWFARYGNWAMGVPNEVLRYFPHAAICQLRLWDAAGNGPAYGTGFYIANEVLLSCGHNFWDRDDGWNAARVEVQPAFSPNMSVLPSKAFSVSAQSIVHPKWYSNRDPGYDLSVLRVPGLPATAGAFSLPNVSLAQTVRIVVCGYGKVDGVGFEDQGQRMDGATMTSADWDLAFYPIQTIGGHSGSPVFHETMVVAVHTGPRLTGPNVDPATGRDPYENRGVLLTPEKNDWIIRLAGGGVSVGLSVPRARAFTDANSTQSEQSAEVRRRVARSVGLAETGLRYDLVHDDSNRINFGIGSWTGTRIADVLDTYDRYAAANGRTDQLHAHFGGQAGFDAIRARFRSDGTATALSAAERAQLTALGQDGDLTGAQDEHLANDIAADLHSIGNDGPPWYPFIDAGMGAISEIAAHVLVHARHQAGGQGLRTILDDVTTYFGGEAALGQGMVNGTITERAVLDRVAEGVIARVQERYREGVRRRYERLFNDHSASDLSYYFAPAN